MHPENDALGTILERGAQQPVSSRSTLLRHEPSTEQRIFLLLAFAFVVCARMPRIVLDGRLWAEEGLFFHNALTLSPWRALWTEYGGYLNLVANAAGLLARYLVPLEAAPWMTTGLGLLFQLSPALLIVTSRAGWVRRPRAMLAALLILATPPFAEEVWLQTLHSQFQLTLCAALILTFDDAAATWLKLLRLALLFLAPLCGLTAVMLLPLFALRAFVQRSRERALQTAILGLGCAIQLGLFYSAASGAALGRSSTVWPGIIVYASYVRLVLVPFLGEAVSSSVATGVTAALRQHNLPLVPVVGLALFVAVLGLATLRMWRDAPIWLLLGTFLVAFVSYYGALSGGFLLLNIETNRRYDFIPEVLLGWTLVSIVAVDPRRTVSWVAAAALALMLVLNAVAYTTSASTHFASGPACGDEVRAWRADPTHVIQLWPVKPAKTRWQLELPPGG